MFLISQILTATPTPTVTPIPRTKTLYSQPVKAEVPKPKPKKAKPKKKYVRGANMWRAEVRYALKKQGAYSKEAETFIVHIIRSESRGRANARNGQYLGLMQFGTDWERSEKKRLNPIWSINRTVKAYKQGGYANLRKHWCNHHECRW